MRGRLGATAISASVAAPGLEAGLHRVRLDLPQRSLRLLHHRERHPRRCASALLSLPGAS